MAFTPKQAAPITAALLSELQGDIGANTAAALANILPPIEPGSVLHDNGCGEGSGTRGMLAIAGPSSNKIKIHSTDINESYLDSLRKQAAENQWPVECALMPAQKQTFADGTFTHSLGSACYHCLEGDGAEDVAKEIHRTLRPGGAAVASIWKSLPHAAALVNTRRALFPTPEGEAETDSRLWWVDDETVDVGEKPGQLLGFAIEPFMNKLKDAGFRDIELTTHTETESREDLKRHVYMLWTMLGRPATGWVEEDEEKWDEALEMLERELMATPTCRKTETGGIEMTFEAWFVKAVK